MAAVSKTRSRTSQGTFKPIRKDTRVITIEKKYNVDLGVRSDMKIGNYLSKKGYPSLSKLLKETK